MTQQSHSQAYTLRKPKLKNTHVLQCSLQHYLQQNIFTICLQQNIFTIASKQLRCPLKDEWIKKLWYIYTMEYYLAIKRDAYESVLVRWMNREPSIQSEQSQKEKDKYCIPTHIYGIQKDGTDEFIFKAAMEKQTQRTDLWTRLAESKERG